MRRSVTGSPPGRPDRQAGFSLIEVLAVLVILGIAVSVGVYALLGWSNRERARGAVLEIRTLAGRARAEALARNRRCLLAIDRATRRVQVIDTNELLNLADDVVLAETTLPKELRFADPAGGAAITLPAIGTTHLALFDSNGVVTGTGAIHLLSGDTYARLSLYAAGGTRIERWADSAWRVDS